MGNSLYTTLVSNLVSRLQDGDESSQSELVDLIQTRLLKFCVLLCGNREVAEDICQETLIKSLQNISSLENPATFLGWTYQIAKNMYLDLKRRPANQNFLSEEHLKHFSVDTKMDLILNVQDILVRFDPEDRFLLLLIELEGYSYKEAAQIFEISEDAVRSKLHRLRAAFMKIHNSGEAA